jgi:hypothetical protein
VFDQREIQAEAAQHFKAPTNDGQERKNSKCLNRHMGREQLKTEEMNAEHHHRAEPGGRRPSEKARSELSVHYVNCDRKVFVPSV